jgi:hypothetical protein
MRYSESKVDLHACAHSMSRGLDPSRNLGVAVYDQVVVYRTGTYFVGDYYMWVTIDKGNRNSQRSFHL